MDLRSNFEPIITHQLHVLLTLSALLLEWIRYPLETKFDLENQGHGPYFTETEFDLCDLSDVENQGLKPKLNRHPKDEISWKITSMSFHNSIKDVLV